MHDLLGLDRDRYRNNLEGVREAVPQLLQLFTQRGVRATWAIVGALACDNWDDYFRRAPASPRYANTQLAVNPRYADLDPDGVLHFAPDLVALVAKTTGQDLGTHTFSHLYLGELGVMQADAAADHAATLALFRERFGVTPTSLVFPRNQVAFLAFYRAQGISAWRDNESSWYYQLTRHTNHPVVRGLRMMDALTPWRVRGGSVFRWPNSFDAVRAGVPAGKFMEVASGPNRFRGALDQAGRRAALLVASAQPGR